MQVSEQCTDLKIYLKINTFAQFLTVDFTASCVKHKKHWTKHLTYSRDNTNYQPATSLPLSICLNIGAECHFW